MRSAQYSTVGLTQGPRGTVSAKSRWSVHILRDSLSSLGRFLKVNPSFSKSVKLAATLTLVVENFFSQMRWRNDIMPTALEFAYVFGPTIRESLKQLTNTGFVYYTSVSSHYELPDEKKFPFRDLPRISFPPSVAMTKEDQKLMWGWRDNFGKPVRQLTVKNQSTKDNVGNLPLHPYTTPDPTPSPLDFSTMANPTGWSTEDSRDTEAERNNSRDRRGVVQLGSQHWALWLWSAIKFIPEVPNNGLFLVGKVTTCVIDEEHWLLLGCWFIFSLIWGLSVVSLLRKRENPPRCCDRQGRWKSLVKRRQFNQTDWNVLRDLPQQRKWHWGPFTWTRARRRLRRWQRPRLRRWNKKRCRLGNIAHTNLVRQECYSPSPHGPVAPSLHPSLPVSPGCIIYQPVSCSRLLYSTPHD